MVKAKTDKLEDYLDGFAEIKYPGIFPLGAVLVDETDRKKVLDIAKSKKIEVHDLSAPPSVTMLNVLRAFVGGRGTAKKVLLIMSKDLYDQNWDLQKLVSSICRL